mmetsp:Transcript_129007/g.275333  ORF Transcript_129007/g.275333 Transcript_129007/m.275333 type:complete len:372 (+) Transcript_129007:69-1184(+)
MICCSSPEDDEGRRAATGSPSCCYGSLCRSLSGISLTGFCREKIARADSEDEEEAIEDDESQESLEERTAEVREVRAKVIADLSVLDKSLRRPDWSRTTPVSALVAERNDKIETLTEPKEAQQLDMTSATPMQPSILPLPPQYASDAKIETLTEPKELQQLDMGYFMSARPSTLAPPPQYVAAALWHQQYVAAAPLQQYVTRAPQQQYVAMAPQQHCAATVPSRVPGQAMGGKHQNLAVEASTQPAKKTFRPRPRSRPSRDGAQSTGEDGDLTLSRTSLRSSPSTSTTSRPEFDEIDAKLLRYFEDHPELDFSVEKIRKGWYFFGPPIGKKVNIKMTSPETFVLKVGGGYVTWNDFFDGCQLGGSRGRHHH